MSAVSRLATVLRRERPETVQLAESLSLATLIDPPLIRSMRMRLHPEFHTAVEADFWFSRFVESRASDGVVLDSDMAVGLRGRLKAAGRLDASWVVVQELHAGVSPAVRIEEEVAWLAARGDAQSMEQIRAHLRNALAGLVAGDREGLGMWALRALPRMSAEVRELDESRMLLAAAKARLTGELEEIENRPEWRWLLPSVALTTTPIRVRLFDGALEFGPALEEGRHIAVPQTRPMVLRVESGASAEIVRFDLGETRTVSVSRGSVKVLTADGAVHEVHPAEVVDYEPILSQHSEFYDPNGLLNVLLDIVSERPGARVVMTGSEGAGKTALFAQFSRRAVAHPKAFVLAQHFFSMSSRFWRDPTTAARSLCAQVEAARPDLEVPELSVFARLEYLLKNYSGGYPKLYVVVDALDEIDPGEEKNQFLDALSVPLSPDVGMVLGMRRGSTTGRWERLAETEVLDLDKFVESRDRDAVPRAILRDSAIRATVEQLVTFAEGNPLQACLLRHLHSVYPSIAVTGSDALESVGTAITNERDQQAIALVCAMREPVLLDTLEQIVGERLGPDFVDRVIGLLSAHESRLWPRHEVVRRLVLSGKAISLQPHAILARHFAGWPILGARDPEVLEYQLRYELFHFQESAAPGDTDLEVHRRITDLGYVESMCRVLGVDDAIAVLEQALSRMTGKMTSEEVLEILRANRSRLQRAPSEVRTLAYRRSVETSPAGTPGDGSDVFRTFHFSDGVPGLRPRRPALPIVYGFGAHRGAVRGCTVDGNDRLLSWGDDGTLRVWDRRNGTIEEVAEFPAPIDCGLRMGESRLVLGLRDGSVWSVSQTTRPMQIRSLGTHRAGVRGMASLDADQWCSWSADGGIRVWSLGSGFVKELSGHEDEVLHCVVVQPGHRLASASADRTIRIWDIDTGAVVRVLGGTNGHKAAVNKVCVFGERNLLSASDDTTLRLWDIDTGSALRVFPGHDLAVTDCAVAPDGFFLSASLDRTARLWSIHEPTVQAVFSGHEGAVYQCAFLDASSVVTCSADRTVRVWANDGRSLGVFYQHTGAVRHFVMMDEDPRTVVSCSDDGALGQWVPLRPQAGVAP